MIILYSINGCQIIKKCRNYLKENNIDFIEKNIYKVLLNKNDYDHFINLIDFKEIDYDEVKNNPSLLKSYYVISDDIEKESVLLEKINKSLACDKSCSHYKLCQGLKNE